MQKILLLEDDIVLSREITAYLSAKGYGCTAVFDGEEFLSEYTKQNYSCYILDINVPKINGIAVCKKLRANHIATPILFLTAFGEIQDKIDGYQSGADDYLVKPFHLQELEMRISSLLRRIKAEKLQNEILEIDDLEMNLTEMTVKRGGVAVILTPKEFKLLQLLVQANGRVLSKQFISEHIWDIHFDSNLNTIEVYINYLRKKIDKTSNIKLIHTRPGFGYYIKPEE